MRRSINPFTALANSANEYKKLFLHIWHHDTDDLIEDTIKIFAFYRLYLISPIIFASSLHSSIKLLMLFAAYMITDRVADKVGDFFDHTTEAQSETLGIRAKIASYIGNIVGDVTEDAWKLFFIVKHYAMDTISAKAITAIKQNKLPHLCKIALQLFQVVNLLDTISDLLAEYSKWNEISDGVGNYAEDQLHLLFGLHNTTQNESTCES
jgi:hypothetical protein